ncbi:MAG: PorV/PorQ family protein [Candidatus Firestonebacteria bacterium]
MKKIIFLILFLILNAYADNMGEELSVIPHLRMGVGARALGLGGAFVGLADDATTTYWNPAGLGRISIYKTHISAMYTKMSYDRMYNFLSIYDRGDYGGVGLNWNNFMVDNIEERDESGELKSLFNYSVNTFTVSYGNSILDNFKAGLNLKYYYIKTGSSDAKGLGFDIGTLYKPFGPLFQIGLVIQDVNFGIYWNTGKRDVIYPVVKCGFSYNIIYEKFIVVADIEKPFNTGFKTHFGTEYWLNEYFGIRGGLSEVNLTAGLSFKITNYQVDYSYLLDNNNLGDIHRFSALAYF